ncbi:MAG: amidase [Rhizobiales bacterium]|nr:amidase [Hyphomicrobiales bacterium]
MSDPCLLPAIDLATMIRDRKISPSELLAAYSARIEKFNPALNAIVQFDSERAQETARAADDIIASGNETPPLFGLPCTIKDAFEVSGMVSTGGIPNLKEHMPARDADVVARVRKAGANIIGKTNVPFASGDFQSFNDIYGCTNNPYDLERTPGGSSGGAAAAVVAGMTAFETGSDIGGSIRLPAHFCGLFGHKSSYDIVPMRGHLPPKPGYLAASDLSVAGPLARSARDLPFLLANIAGATNNAWRLDLPSARTRNPKNLRVAVWLDEPFTDVDVESAALIEAAAKALSQAGAKVDFDARPDFTMQEAFVNYALVLYAIVASDFPAHMRVAMIEAAKSSDPEDISHPTLQARSAALNYADWLNLNQERARLQSIWATFFQSYDVVLCPAAPGPAFAHDHQGISKRRLEINGVKRPYLDIVHWAGLASGSYLPASVAPVGQTKSGLPVGVQIIGPWLEDHTPMAVAAMLEDLIGGFVPAKDFA